MAASLRSLLRIRTLTAALMAMFLVATVHAQSQASCTFHTFALNSSPQIFITGVNDYGTVVGFADFGVNATPQYRGFIHYSGGSTSYWVPSGAKQSSFGGRNDGGVTTGYYYDSSFRGHPVLLKGATLTAISTPGNGSPNGINKYGSIAGGYTDNAGTGHGFKRYANGSAIVLNFPGAVNTDAVGINDSGVVVGTYVGTDAAEHGFIYRNGAWAKLQYPTATQSTELYGISNNGVIVGQGQAHAFLYTNGTFKDISAPGSSGTQVRAIAPGGLIAGMADLTHGFLASCH
jgi:probable HAF family extracellular repeat protein